MLLTQHVLISINTDSIRDDFCHGKNGAIKLSEEEFKFLDSLYNEMLIKHQRVEGDLTFVQQAHKVAEHYVMIVDGKQREVIGTTYNKLKEIIVKINQCGYFDKVRECSEAAPMEEVWYRKYVESIIRYTILRDLYLYRLLKLRRRSRSLMHR